MEGENLQDMATNTAINLIEEAMTEAPDNSALRVLGYIDGVLDMMKAVHVMIEKESGLWQEDS